MHDPQTCWDGPLGAVRLLDRPSWLTALPQAIARAPCCTFSALHPCKTLATIASPRPYPSAAESNV